MRPSPRSCCARWLGAAGVAPGAADDFGVAVASVVSETAANLETIARATQERTAAIEEIDRGVEQSRTLSALVVQDVSETSRSMEPLVATGRRINTVADFINGIAHSTNLLALNVTIAASVEQQRASTSEIVENITQVSVGASEMARTMTSVKDTILTSKAVAESAYHAAESVVAGLEKLNARVDTMLGSLRK